MTDEKYEEYGRLRGEVAVTRSTLDVLDRILSFEYPIAEIYVYGGLDEYHKKFGEYLSTYSMKFPVEALTSVFEQYRREARDKIDQLEKRMLEL